MAIVIEEKKSIGSTNMVSVVVWLILLAFLCWGAYYIFFQRTDAIMPVLSSEDKINSSYAALKVDDSALLKKLSDPKIFSSHAQVSPVKPSARQNPFLPL